MGTEFGNSAIITVFGLNFQHIYQFNSLSECTGEAMYQLKIKLWFLPIHIDFEFEPEPV